jgi:hypothetical protein
MGRGEVRREAQRQQPRQSALARGQPCPVPLERKRRRPPALAHGVTWLACFEGPSRA